MRVGRGTGRLPWSVLLLLLVLVVGRRQRCLWLDRSLLRIRVLLVWLLWQGLAVVLLWRVPTLRRLCPGLLVGHCGRRGWGLLLGGLSLSLVVIGLSWDTVGCRLHIVTVLVVIVGVRRFSLSHELWLLVRVRWRVRTLEIRIWLGSWVLTLYEARLSVRILHSQ